MMDVLFVVLRRDQHAHLGLPVSENTQTQT